VIRRCSHTQSGCPAHERAPERAECAQAVLPVLREMGGPRGHPLQASLELRLALVAAAPWKRLERARVLQPAGAARASPAASPLASPAGSPAGSPAKPGAGADPAARAQAEAQADALLDLAWSFVFKRHSGFPLPVEIRRAQPAHLWPDAALPGVR
jgi:hypothetical protein